MNCRTSLGHRINWALFTEIVFADRSGNETGVKIK